MLRPLKHIRTDLPGIAYTQPRNSFRYRWEFRKLGALEWFAIRLGIHLDGSRKDLVRALNWLAACVLGGGRTR